MLLPLIQKVALKIKEKPLSGDIKITKNVNWSLQDWFSGEYSVDKGKFFNDNFGFHSFFVRLKNQLYYSAFKEIFAKDIVEGKDGFLYEIKYLQAHAGLDFVGKEEIEKRLEKVKFIQDTLSKRGIKFVLLFAPERLLLS